MAPSVSLQLSPFLLLLLLYRLCPQHFPPSTTTSKLFVLYTLASQLLIRRASALSLLRHLLLLLLAHVLVAAIFALHCLARAAHLAQRALLALYADVAKGVELSVQGVAAHLALVDASSSPPSPAASSSGPSPDLPVACGPPPDELFRLRLLQGLPSPLPALLYASSSRLRTFARPPALGVHGPILSRLCAVASLYDRAAWSLCIARIRFVLLVNRLVEPVFRAWSHLVSLCGLYSPIMAIFSLHFVFWAILLSMGELFAFWACLLSMLWMLSLLSHIPL
ncbi:dna-directed rna polymerase ii subunit rpb1 [Trichoderma cornu-damae]|uniref:Dna-directed rna polymerase ii subunit rpb1 n=1 Tax=Trichoderma cornu-damae TaxID=654480 RepID=A0A9P8QS04_9HYPO|nr:dna-directed rna polymerase ii subunit rpb1 [Trichoderma cornu-damae]